MDMTPAEMNSVSSLIVRAKGLLPVAFAARTLARLAVALDRDAAIKTVNKWTPDEAKKLGFLRCDNDPHDGLIAYYEEHGREQTENGIFRKLRCPACKHETRTLVQRTRSRTPSYSIMPRW